MMLVQPNLKIEAEEKKKYRQRMVRSMVVNFIMVVAVFILIGWGTHMNLQKDGVFFILFCPIFLLILLYPADDICTYFISKFEITGDKVCINYSKRNKQYSVEGLIDDFTFYQGHGSKANGYTDFLEISYQNKIIVRQYDKWGWDKGLFREALNYLTQRNILEVRVIFSIRKKI